MRIGTDILSLKRLKAVLENYENRFVFKILSKAEKEIYDKLSNDRRKLEFLGGRFCGKEAIFKAAEADEDIKLTWKRISFLPNFRGAPDIFIDDNRVSHLSLSISHEKDYVIATTINFKN